MLVGRSSLPCVDARCGRLVLSQPAAHSLRTVARCLLCCTVRVSLDPIAGLPPRSYSQLASHLSIPCLPIPASSEQNQRSVGPIQTLQVVRVCPCIRVGLLLLFVSTRTSVVSAALSTCDQAPAGARHKALYSRCYIQLVGDVGTVRSAHRSLRFIHTLTSHPTNSTHTPDLIYHDRSISLLPLFARGLHGQAVAGIALRLLLTSYSIQSVRECNREQQQWCGVQQRSQQTPPTARTSHQGMQ